jgi:peptidoglycan/xylan/chitin deacetylase (PgdA/CDA1 family)
MAALHPSRLSVTGARRAVQRAWLRRRGVVGVLMYHRVAAPDTDFWGLAVHPDRFREHLEVIRRHYRPIRLMGLAESLRAGSVPRSGVVLTFDDGYCDNLDVAKPLLEQYEVPATVFPLTGYAGTGRNFWWDELEEICFRGNLPASGALDGREAAVSWSGSRDDACRSLGEQLRPLSHEARLGLLDRLRALASPKAAEPPKPLTREGIAELGRGGLIEVGAHTVTHPMLTALAPEAVFSEIRESKERLEELTGHRVETFSYPYGDHDETAVECVRNLGFAAAVTVEPRPVAGSVDLLELPRFYVGDWSGSEFEARLRRLLADL